MAEAGAVDYGNLIERAWRLTWRHRFLWVLGFFATTTVGSCSFGGGGGGPVQWQVGGREVNGLPGDVESVLELVRPWVARNLELIAAVAAVLALLGLLLLVVSVIAQGAMARATADLALGRPIGLGQAWGAGVRLFWRYLGLWLLVLLLGVAIVLAIAAVGGALALLIQETGGALRLVLIGLAGLLGIAAALAAIPVFIALAVAVAYAQRALAVENVGPLAGLKVGFRLVRQQLGTSALVWLVNLALAIAAGLAIVVGVLLLLIPVAAVGAVLFVSTVGLTVLIPYLLVAAALLGIGAWFLGAIANSFFWSYWTLAYLRLTGRLTERLEVPAEG